MQALRDAQVALNTVDKNDHNVIHIAAKYNKPRMLEVSEHDLLSKEEVPKQLRSCERSQIGVPLLSHITSI